MAPPEWPLSGATARSTPSRGISLTGATPGFLEVAARMNRSENAVRLLLARAAMKLRESFGDTESLHLPDRTFNTESDIHGKE